MSSLVRRLLPAAAAFAGALSASASLAHAGSPGQFGYGKTGDASGDRRLEYRRTRHRRRRPAAGPRHGQPWGGCFCGPCAACHGTFGEGEGRYPKLMGGEGTLTADRPEPSVGSYWPYAPTLWDYINRAMPFIAPHSLAADDVYALTAYILNFNNIVPGNFVADRDSLPKVKMPNRDNFTWKDPRPDTAATECMKNCIDPKSVKIISTAEGKDLTPRTTGPLDQMQPK